jgi:hypothetical protein
MSLEDANRSTTEHAERLFLDRVGRPDTAWLDSVHRGIKRAVGPGMLAW